MNKLYFSFLSLCMGMPLWAADFSGSIAHVSNDNNTIIVTELPIALSINSKNLTGSIKAHTIPR